MSRLGAGFGSAIGIVVGTMLGSVAAHDKWIPPQPGFTPEDDEAMANGITMLGALIGGVAGAAIGAGSSDPKPASPGALGAPPRAARFP